MATEVFTLYRPHASTIKIIEQANAIILEYRTQGFTLTLRQLFYQFVARGLLENNRNKYQSLGRFVRDARDGGMIDWDAIEDRTREVNTHSSWDSPADIISSAADSYREDLWKEQTYRSRGVGRKGRVDRRHRGRLHRAARAVLRPSRQQQSDAAIPSWEAIRGISAPSCILPTMIPAAST
jgi:hypothetical protein